MKGSVLERFFAKIAIDLYSDCWEWQASHTIDGYGQFYFRGKVAKAHRASYELFVGAIPDDRQLDHLCRLRSCVNPDHLEVVTPKENHHRSAQRSVSWRNHCPQGHPYDEANTYVNPNNGARSCRICARAKNLRQREKRTPFAGMGTGIREKSRTHCPQGHIYNAENTYIDPKGFRHCQPCRRLQVKQFYYRQKIRTSID